MTHVLDATMLAPGFEYPALFRRVVELGLTELEPWLILDGEWLRERRQGLRDRYPARDLVPFAQRQDNDDVAGTERPRGSASSTTSRCRGGSSAPSPTSAVRAAVSMIVNLLVRREYEVVERITGGVRLRADDLETVVSRYRLTLVEPGDGWWETVDVTPVDASDKVSFHVAAPLWSEEEGGRSDLTLELLLTEIGNELYETQVLDLHPL